MNKTKQKYLRYYNMSIYTIKKIEPKCTEPKKLDSIN